MREGDFLQNSHHRALGVKGWHVWWLVVKKKKKKRSEERNNVRRKVVKRAFELMEGTAMSPPVGAHT